MRKFINLLKKTSPWFIVYAMSMTFICVLYVVYCYKDHKIFAEYFTGSFDKKEDEEVPEIWDN